MKAAAAILVALTMAGWLYAQPVQARPGDPAPGTAGRRGGSWLVAQDFGRDGASLPAPQGGFRRGLRRRQLEEEAGPAGEAGNNLEGGSYRRWSPGATGPGPGRFAPDTGAMPGRRFPGREGLGQFGNPGQGRAGAGGRVGGMAINLGALGLSEEQKQRIRELRGQNSGKARALRLSLREKRAEMRQLMFDPNASEEQIRAKRRELRRMQDRMEEMQIEDFLSLRSVLTPEQRQRLPEIMPGNQQARNFPRPDAAPQSGVGQ